jgi:hypothetical protein
MSTNNMNNEPRKSTQKPGRTLLVKVVNDFDQSVLDTLTGKQSIFVSEKSKSYFVTFSTPDESLEALKYLKNNFSGDVRVKFAHYRIYFTVKGLTNDSDYNFIKTTHTTLVSKSCDCNVLYYRLYRKNDTYLGCGDFTIDTKEGFDNLMTQDDLKNFTLSSTVTGVHYRYNKNKETEFSTPKQASASS